MQLLLILALCGGQAGSPVLHPRAGTLRIAVTGDTGKGTDAVGAGIRRVHAEKPLDAIVLAGDNFYPCGVTSEHDPRWSLVRGVTSIGVPVLPVLGNHDYCGKADPDAQIRATGVVPNWSFPARRYVVRAGVADFAFLDTTAFLLNKGDPQLAEAFRSSTAPWRIVVGHHPVLSSGYHGYFPRDEVKRMRELIPSLRASRVDLYIAGHDHHVELIRERMLHLISGAGSEPIPPVKLRLRTVFPPEIGIERVAFAVVEIDARTIRVRFYDAKARPKSDWIVARHGPD
ncbi:MAG TPA: metallophosphoesterase [Thermoanaerobaculia bacterium]|nr:metallophosphoesterase [Thermoanaerobaculia bacterium]